MQKIPIFCGIGSWMLAGSLQVSGYSNLYVAIALALIGVVAFAIAGIEWVKEVKSRGVISKAEDFEITDLRKLSNEELRNKSIFFANTMRAFEASHDEVVSNNLHMRHSRENITEEQRRAEWHAQNQRETQHRSSHQTEFNINYRPIGLALLNEISRRLGIYPPYPKDRGDRAFCLDIGMLAGASPVAMAADYLDELARKLK